MCRVDDCEYVSVYREQTRSARKLHRCHECGGHIQPNDSYVYTTYLVDGHWETVRTCTECLPCREWLMRQCGGFIWTGVYEDLTQHWAEGLHELALGRLIVGMRRRREAATV